MADPYWLGTATAVAQVTTVAVTAYDVTTTYKITVGGVVISSVGTGGTTATTAAAIAALWNASTHPYCAAVTAAAVATNTITFTADTAGVPFVITSSVTGGTGTIGAASTGTASAGPNHWDTAANWSTNTVPVNTDKVYIRASAEPILWGLAQSAVAPALVSIEQSFSGPLAQIGLPYNKFTTSKGVYSTTTVPEYRDTYLAISAVLLRIGENFTSSGNLTGSPLLKIDTASANCAASVFNSGTSTDGLPPVRLKMNHASATLKVYNNSKVGLCWEVPGETGQVSEVDGFVTESGGVYVGSGVTQAVHNQQSGFGILKNAPTTARVEAGGRLTLAATSGTITTLEKRGELTLAGSVTVTNLRG